MHVGLTEVVITTSPNLSTMTVIQFIYQLTLSLMLVESRKFDILNKIADIEYEEIPEKLTFIASIRYKDKPICGGSLVREDMVMTLANLVDSRYQYDLEPSLLTCRVGNYLINVEGVGIPIAKIIFHPSYNYSTTTGNIALLRLRQKAVGLESIDLPSDLLHYGSKCKVIGWGKRKTNESFKRVLSIVNVMLIDIHECNKKMMDLTYHTLLKTVPPLTKLDSDNHICSKTDRHENPNMDAAGSLLICNGIQHGIVAFKLYEEEAMTSRMFFWVSIRLDKYREWLKDVVVPISKDIADEH